MDCQLFSGNQLPQSMANSSETHLKENSSLKYKEKSSQIMPPVA